MDQFIDRWTKPCMFTYEVLSALRPPEFFRLWQCLCFLANWGAVCTAQYKNRYNTVCSDKYKYKRPAVCAAKYNLFAISVQAQHAVLIGTGIGVTPYASILQSIMHRWLEVHLARVALSLWPLYQSSSCRRCRATDTDRSIFLADTGRRGTLVRSAPTDGQTTSPARCRRLINLARHLYLSAATYLVTIWGGNFVTSWKWFETALIQRWWTCGKLTSSGSTENSAALNGKAFPRNIKSSGRPKSKSLRSQKQ